MSNVETLITKTERILDVVDRHIAEPDCKHSIREIMREALA